MSYIHGGSYDRPKGDPPSPRNNKNNLSKEDQVKKIKSILGERTREGSGFVFKFGKYKGEDLADVPATYLIWIKNNSQNEKMVDIIQGELNRRQSK